MTRALMAAALMGGAGMALSAGSAQAQTACGEQISWAAWVGGQDLTCGDKTFSHLSTATLGDLASSLVSAQQPMAGDYIFNLDFPTFTTSPFDFTYLATITDPSRAFTAVDLDTDADGFADPPSILTATFTGGTDPVVLTSTNGSMDLESVSGHPTVLTVQNQYNGDGAIDTIENSFQQKVPGPLPILGAGMAFGFSRKLRRRIKANAFQA
jgi:hypothetical protein